MQKACAAGRGGPAQTPNAPSRRSVHAGAQFASGSRCGVSHLAGCTELVQRGDLVAFLRVALVERLHKGSDIAKKGGEKNGTHHDGKRSKKLLEHSVGPNPRRLHQRGEGPVHGRDVLVHERGI